MKTPAVIGLMICIICESHKYLLMVYCFELCDVFYFHIRWSSDAKVDKTGRAKAPLLELPLSRALLKRFLTEL